MDLAFEEPTARPAGSGLCRAAHLACPVTASADTLFGRVDSVAGKPIPRPESGPLTLPWPRPILAFDDDSRLMAGGAPQVMAPL
jgi:hypothetical protein